MSMNDGVILLSGGMDSVTLLHHIKHTYPNATLHALTMYYGQRHPQEMKYSNYWCKKLNIRHDIYKLSFLKDMVRNVSSMIGESQQIGRAHV